MIDCSFICKWVNKEKSARDQILISSTVGVILVLSKFLNLVQSVNDCCIGKISSIQYKKICSFHSMDFLPPQNEAPSAAVASRQGPLGPL